MAISACLRGAWGLDRDCRSSLTLAPWPVTNFAKARPARRAFAFSGHLLGGRPLFLDELQQRLAAVSQAMAILDLVEKSHGVARQIQRHLSIADSQLAPAIGSDVLRNLGSGFHRREFDSVTSKPTVGPKKSIVYWKSTPESGLHLEISNLIVKRGCKNIRQTSHLKIGSRGDSTPESRSWGKVIESAVNNQYGQGMTGET
jgi:hypothetical protein